MHTNNAIGQHLRQILTARDLTATELARMADIRTSFIYDVLSGKSKNPSIVTLAKLAKALDISLHELAGTEGESEGFGQHISSDYTAIPKLDIDVSAGPGSDIDDEYANIEHYIFKRSWIQGKLATSPNHLRMLKITGDSMEPTLSHGDVILVDTSKTKPSPPGIFVLHDGFGLVVKRLDLLPDGAEPKLVIKSDNSQYSAYERKLSDTRIIARVVWFAREL